MLPLIGWLSRLLWGSAKYATALPSQARCMNLAPWGSLQISHHTAHYAEAARTDKGLGSYLWGSSSCLWILDCSWSPPFYSHLPFCLPCGHHAPPPDQRQPHRDCLTSSHNSIRPNSYDKSLCVYGGGGGGVCAYTYLLVTDTHLLTSLPNTLKLYTAHILPFLSQHSLECSL